MSSGDKAVIMAALISLIGVIYSSSVLVRNNRVSKRVEYQQAELEHIRVEQANIIANYKTMAEENRKLWEDEYSKRVKLEFKLEAAFREIDHLKAILKERENGV